MLSILLLAVFGLTFASPLIALGTKETTVRACCRRGGAHACGMSMAERSAEAEPGHRVRAPFARCPYAPQIAGSVHVGAAYAGSSGQEMTPPESHGASVAQAEASWRIARERSHQKRGPPVA